MNSFYKKIALICLVSLTANQAALAVQVPSFWHWMKGNQKTTAAIVAGFAALAIFARWMSKPKKAVLKSWSAKEILVKSAHSSNPDTLIRTVCMPRGNMLTIGEPIGARAANPHLNLTTFTLEEDVPKGDGRYLGGIVFAKPNRMHDIYSLEYISATTKTYKNRLLNLIIDDNKDIAMGRDVSDADVAYVRQRIKANDSIEPVYEGRVFRRDAVRAKLGISQQRPAVTITNADYEQQVKDLNADRNRVRTKLGDAVFKTTERDELLAAQLEQTQKLNATKPSAISSPAAAATA